MRFASKRLAGLLALLLAPLLVIGGLPLQTQETAPRIAVLEFQPVRADLAEATAAADQLRSELVNLHVFTVLDRGQTEAVLGELAFQQEGITDPAQATELGRLLNVQFIVTGRVTRLVGAYQVNVQMIDVQSGQIVRSESALHRGDFVGLLSIQVPRLAARLARVGTVPPPAGATPPPVAQPQNLPEIPPPSRSDVPRRWPMMGGGGANWPLVAGGMLVMGAAMMAGHSDGADRDSALAVGAVGVGLLGYYWISRTETSTAGAGHGPTRPRPTVLVDLRRDGMGAGIAWRW